MNLAFNLHSYEGEYKQFLISEKDLSFKDCVYLSALMNMATNDNVMELGPSHFEYELITPTKSHLQAIFKHLTKRNILIPIQNNNAAERGSGASDEDFYWYHINVEPMDNIEAFIERIRFLNLQETDNYIDSSYDMWLELSAYELIAMVEHEAAALGIFIPELQWEVDESFKSLVARYSLAQLRTVVLKYLDICMKRHLSGELSESEMISNISNDFPYYLQNLHLTGDVPNLTKREQTNIGSSFIHMMFFKGICGFTDSIYTLKPSKSVLEILMLQDED